MEAIALFSLGILYSFKGREIRPNLFFVFLVHVSHPQKIVTPDILHSNDEDDAL